ncbi:MAG: branched-chain amino acid transaminase [Planctomycetes bacterium]|nr:branched-chain amino acid transaminase [Planctomycetota bacterium]
MNSSGGSECRPDPHTFRDLTGTSRFKGLGVVDKLRSIWMDGALVPWDEAKIHVLTHSFHYGAAAFEGIRSYRLDDGRSAVFRLREHIQRLFDSAKILGFKIPYDFDAVSDACVETLIANGLAEGYVRPIAYIGDGVMGVFPADNPIRLVIAAWKWGAYLGEEGLKRGIRVKVSTYSRYAPNSAMTRAKVTGHYVTGVLAKKEAKALGYDEALMLDPDGYVAEGSGENIFIVRKGVMKTTPLTCILPGITRDTIIELARDLGLTVVEQRFTRDEAYIADEAFFCGTASEVTPIREIDGRPIGRGGMGPITHKFQSLYFDAVRGRAERYAKWLRSYETVPDISGLGQRPAKASAP